MKKLRNKLQSSRGASMLIAMVFMLFCVFVGGSVLTAATANSYRIAHLSDQQEYLDQRSAAILISDQLRTPDLSKLRLTVYDNVQTVQEVQVLASGAVVDKGTPFEVHSFRFTLPTGLTLTALQRSLYETTVWNFLREKGVYLDGGKAFQKIEGGTPVEVRVELENFKFQMPKPDGSTEEQTLTSLSDFWHRYTKDDPAYTDSTKVFSGTLHVTGTQSGGGYLADFDAAFLSDRGEELYDFAVQFGDFSQLEVRLRGYAGESTIPAMEQITQWNNGGTMIDARVTTATEMTILSWSHPTIEKGAA